MADSCVTAKTAAAELAAAAEAGAREIVVEGRLTGSPSITLPEGTTLRGAELALPAEGVRLTTDNVLQDITTTTTPYEVAVYNETRVRSRGPVRPRHPVTARSQLQLLRRSDTTVSNFTGWQLTKAVLTARALGLREPVTLQPPYSLIVRGIEWEIVPAALDVDMGLLPWSPLAGGWLSGKYRRDQRPIGDTRLGEDPGRGMEAYDRRGSERTWRVIDAVDQVTRSRGISMAEVALAWVNNRAAVVSTIIGARTTEQLETNLRAAGLELSTEEYAVLDEASDLDASDYPYGELGVEQRRRNLDGG